MVPYALGVIAGVLKRMVTEGLEVTEFHREERKLEDAFIDLLGKLEADEAEEAAASMEASAAVAGPAAEHAKANESEQ